MSETTALSPLAVAFGAAPFGAELKDTLAATLRDEGFAVHDLGTWGVEPADYPAFAYKVGALVADRAVQLGVLVSGIDMAIAADRHPAIRCAVAHDVTSARLSRAHNNANVLAPGTLVNGEMVAFGCLPTFIGTGTGTGFDGGCRASRVAWLGHAGRPTA